MVLVNKVEELRNKSVYYSKMHNSAPSTSSLQASNTMPGQAMNDPYDKMRILYYRYYMMVFNNYHQGKYFASWYALFLGVITFTLFITSLVNTTYSDRVFPSSFSTYYTKSWRNMSKLDALISDLSKTASPSERIKLTWEWAGCSKYITPNQIPKTNHPATLVSVSSTDPIYVPGGCNCLAQVAGTMKNETFSVGNPYIPYTHIEDQFEFCTLFAPMPTELESKGQSIRVDTFLYGFIFTSLVAIIAANYRHWFMKVNKDTADIYNSGSYQYTSTIFTLILLAVTFTSVITFNTYCKNCDPELKNFNWEWNAVLLAIIVFCVFYFVNLFRRLSPGAVAPVKAEIIDVNKTMNTTLEDEKPDMAQNTVKQARMYYELFRTANKVAGQEQLIFDAISIPALIYLTVGISVLRSWLDVNIIFYNVTLVLFLATFYTASNYISAKWAIDYNKDEKVINDEFQLYKFCSFFAGIFIVLTLTLTALPGVKPNYYHLEILDNWWVFIIILFSIYILPDIVSEFKSVNLQMATAFRQWALLLFVSFVVILQINVEWIKQDQFVNSLF